MNGTWKIRMNGRCGWVLGPVILAAVLLLSCAGAQKPRPVRVPAPVEKGKPYIVDGVTYYPLKSSVGYEEKGVASWYGKQFHGRKTANGEVYDMYGRTAAHKTLPFNTVLQVTNLDNGKKMLVRVNDRGPFVSGRIIDLTYTVAKELGMADEGTAPVQIVAMTRAEEGGDGALYLDRPVPNFDSGQFTVQVGSFISKENAVRLHTSLKKEYGFSSISRFDWGDDVFYRVRVGRYNSLKKAKQSLKTWSDRGFPGSFVVAES